VARRTRRGAHPAIVEPNDFEAAADERRAKRVGPMNVLRRESHDQQHDRGIGVPESLVGDVDCGGPDLRGYLVHECLLVHELIPSALLMLTEARTKN
jgi:hypothetical protein